MYKLPAISIKYDNDRGNGYQKFRVRDIAKYLEYVLDHHQLTIRQYLPEMGNEGFFLVAATGLGKTVATPAHVFLRMCEEYYKDAAHRETREDIPRVYVIEPRIPIAEEEMYHMNELFSQYVHNVLNLKNRRNPVLFGCRTSALTANQNAPIQFITTGVLGLLAENNDLVAGRDRVLIDEAHVTIEQNADVEFAIAVAKKAGVQVDYMSATVDTSNLEQLLGVKNIIKADKKRYEIWLHNLGGTLEETLIELIQNTLISQDFSSEYYPKDDYHARDAVLDGVTPTNRASGMLIVVNSFASENSDVNKYARMIEEAFGDQVKVLKLASETIRDRAKKAAFDKRIARIEKDGEKYIILATSVVEMGITFPTLDYIVTMNSGFGDVVIDDVILPRQVPLGVNALLQRVGRVGRKRPGIGYISREVGAEYTFMNDRQLNSGGLTYETIKLPFENTPLIKLAAYSLKQGWENPIQWLYDLNLPSKIHEDESRLDDFFQARNKLQEMKLSDGIQLTELGEYCYGWIGQTHLPYAVALQEKLTERASAQEVCFYMVMTAIKDSPFSDFVFSKKKVDLSMIKEVELSTHSEPISLYNVIRYFYNKYKQMIIGSVSEYERAIGVELMSDEAYFLNLSSRGLEAIIKNLNSITFKNLVKLNRKRSQLKTLIGGDDRIPLVEFQLPALSRETSLRLMSEIDQLYGREVVSIKKDSFEDYWKWTSSDKTKSGLVSESLTPIHFEEDASLTAHILPRLAREEEHEEEQVKYDWILSHIQVLKYKEA